MLTICLIFILFTAALLFCACAISSVNRLVSSGDPSSPPSLAGGSTQRMKGRRHAGQAPLSLNDDRELQQALLQHGDKDAQIQRLTDKLWFWRVLGVGMAAGLIILVLWEILRGEQ